MGRGLPAYKPSPAAAAANDLGPISVDDTHEPSNVIHIDGMTGHVMTENADGSLTVHDSRPPKRDRGAASFDENLADDPQVPVNTIAARLLEGIEADIASRSEWEETANRGRELLGVNLEKSTGQVGATGTIAQVKNLAYLEAIIRSWANSRAELLPSGGPCKVTDDRPTIPNPMLGHNGGPPLNAPPPPAPTGSPPVGAQPPMAGPTPPGPAMGAAPKPPSRSELADALEKDMNHYLTVVDKDYYPDTSRMLLNRAVNGVQFKKVYRDPLLKRPVSRWVKGEDLIVSNDCSHLSGAGRVTERMRMRQSVVKRLIAIGHWADVSLSMPSQMPTQTERTTGEIEGVTATPQRPEDQLHEIYECYCELEDGPLAEDHTGHVPGFPLPYRVTIDKDSRKVLEIRRNWKIEDEDYTARRRYVKFGFVPGLGFYDWGYVHILGNPQRATTAIECMSIDAGMFASFPGGLMAKGPGMTRNRTTQIRPAPGEFAVIDTGGLPIEQVAMPFPYKGPSGELIAMGTGISADMRRLAGVLEMPVGEGRIGNTPVGTMMAYVDSVTKVPSAIHKDDHAAQAEEFELLKELFTEEPEALTKGSKRPAWEKGYTLEELNDQEIVPKADPNISSQTHRIMQAQALAQAAALPQFAGIANQRAIWEDFVTRVLGIEEPENVTMPEGSQPPPPPPPQVIAAQIKSADNDKSLAAKAAMQDKELQGKETVEGIRAQTDASNQASEERRAGMHLMGETVKAKKDLATHGVDTATDLHKHAVDTVTDHAQHLDTIAQGDRHKGIDAALAQATAQNPDDKEPT